MTAIEKPDVIGATRRAETIRNGMIGYAAAMEAIGEAFEARDWVALGHKNWDEYCEKEFSEKRLKLTQQQREQAVLAFRGAGMSIRAIGSALGISTTTIQRDLSQSDTPAEVVGGDGKTYPASRPAQDTPVDQPPAPDAPEPAADLTRTGDDHGQPEVDRQDSLPGEADEGADLSAVDGGGTPSAEREQQRAGVSAAAPAINLVKTPVGPMTPGFAKALDELVPPANPHAAWQKGFLDAVLGARKAFRKYKGEEIAEKADQQLLEEFAGLVADVDDLMKDTSKAQIAAAESKVFRLRSVS